MWFVAGVLPVPVILHKRPPVRPNRMFGRAVTPLLRTPSEVRLCFCLYTICVMQPLRILHSRRYTPGVCNKDYSSLPPAQEINIVEREHGISRILHCRPRRWLGTKQGTKDYEYRRRLPKGCLV
ncbi:hypothetical protein T440DRAFT_229122 [Plenodomus tracheiphilus IPT5]|uniref:Uncharacterized protein n=1 Tax=Plenodomus tracheiphilus IPT5 TaxID=1408161 RepID=A0A6A7ASV7_9PLEO|nr:hypothetical protein T440DRAFT_229122 [Plenodomus tracheiphilus IPT5]